MLKNKNNNKQNCEEETATQFFKEILYNLISQRNSYDLRTEIMMAISGGIFLFSMQSILDKSILGTTSFIIIASSSLLSCILCVFSLRPPSLFLNRKRLLPSIIHHTSISKMTPKQFSQKIEKVIQDKRKIRKEYEKMVYNLAVFQTVRKKYFINLAGRILIIGLSVGFIMIFNLP